MKPVAIDRPRGARHLIVDVEDGVDEITIGCFRSENPRMMERVTFRPSGETIMQDGVILPLWKADPSD